AHAGADLEQIRARDRLRCGVSEGIAGFSLRDAAGRWAGLDVDFCRAVAAALLRDPEKVELVPLTAAARFPALQGGRIDLLLRNTTWTLAREAGLGVRFTGVLFYDTQAILVPGGGAARAPEDLAGETVCVERGTDHEANLARRLAASGRSFAPLVLPDAAAAAEAFFAGRCRAYTSDASQLAAALLRAPGGRGGFAILPEQIAREPLAPSVRAGDEEWFALVRWVLFALLTAEERGITQAAAADAGRARALVVPAAVAAGLGTDPEWALRAVRAGGNYGEIFERHFGAASGLDLERGANRIWTQGGLHFAPPLAPVEASAR
ncbi:MAG TPA: amino acid ABC transporter substrate-binding protein, partial [Myxococcota bacterium]|nr:amino acid ABC transporter substrate-binding protein [Myxococcota bacterium]